MGKQRKKTITAGALVYEALYPLPNPRDSRAVRQGKKNLTSAAQARMNRKRQWMKLELLLAVNFRPGDIVLTLTFDDGHLPDSRDKTMQRVRMFLKHLRQERGCTNKYIYVVEHNHSKVEPWQTDVERAQQGRYHVHMVLNSTGDDYDAIKRSWPYGLTEMHKLEINRDRTYESLARYYCKELQDKPGARTFIPSRGLTQPEVDCRIVSSKENLDPPKGSVVYDNTGRIQTDYGHYQFVKYLWPKLVEHAPSRRKRIRKNGLS